MHVNIDEKRLNDTPSVESSQRRGNISFIAKGTCRMYKPALDAVDISDKTHSDRPYVGRLAPSPSGHLHGTFASN